MPSIIEWPERRRKGYGEEQKESSRIIAIRADAIVCLESTPNDGSLVYCSAGFHKYIDVDYETAIRMWRSALSE